MLIKRLVTAGILLPLVILGILYLPLNYFRYLSILVFSVGAWEWTRLSGFESLVDRLIGLTCMALLIFLYWVIFAFVLVPANYIAMPIINAFVITFWYLALCAVLFYPKGSWLYRSKAMGVIIGTLILVPACIALVILKNYGPDYLLYLMCVVWAADTGAYFAGRAWGKHKLSPIVSPGKTWEGVLGAIVLSSCVIAVSYYILDVEKSFASWMLLGIIVVIASIIGDLFESLFKRLRNLKDSGNILPGHGGVLDRLDSLIPAMPIFVLGIALEWYVFW
jgi:phosphatidate cytidylyltransferase